MWRIIGWIIWGLLACCCFSFIYGCRTYAKAGISFMWTTGVQAFFCCFIAVLFLVFSWNKFHILWITPIAYFTAPYLAFREEVGRGVPVLSPLVFFATGIFLKIILVGIKPNGGL